MDYLFPVCPFFPLPFVVVHVERARRLQAIFAAVAFMAYGWQRRRVVALAPTTEQGPGWHLRLRLILPRRVLSYPVLSCRVLS
jgi:hypothetical protein